MRTKHCSTIDKSFFITAARLWAQLLPADMTSLLSDQLLSISHRAEKLSKIFSRAAAISCSNASIFVSIFNAVAIFLSQFMLAVKPYGISAIIYCWFRFLNNHSATGLPSSLLITTFNAACPIFCSSCSCVPFVSRQRLTFIPILFSIRYNSSISPSQLG